jgi:hypothetical protein
MAQTAVEWLEWLYKEGILNQKSFEIGKEKEKEQTEQAYMRGLAWMMPEDSERVTIVKSKWKI